jgi:serine protease Do
VKALFRFLPVLALSALLAAPVHGDDKKTDPTTASRSVSVLDKPAPENVEDLRALQQRVKEVLRKVIPATVGVQVGQAAGSGVIIDKEGHVLTAGHVSGRPNQDATLILSDGRRIKAKALGNNRGIDSGLFQIVDKGEFPYVQMGKSESLKRGQWVIAAGHPGGYRPGRTPPVRLGRVLAADENSIRTDCTLVGGDSGGPLFDLDGKVVGIHSRIGGTLSNNIHVPVDTYLHTWDRLVKGDAWTGGARDSAYLGVELDDEARGCKISKVIEKSAAALAGLKVDDLILKFDALAMGDRGDLRNALVKKNIGDTITLTVRRGKETIDLKVKLGRRED